jgi:hypothetical protein
MCMLLCERLMCVCVCVYVSPVFRASVEPCYTARELVVHFFDAASMTYFYCVNWRFRVWFGLAFPICL